MKDFYEAVESRRIQLRRYLVQLKESIFSFKFGLYLFLFVLSAAVTACILVWSQGSFSDSSEEVLEDTIPFAFTSSTVGESEESPKMIVVHVIGEVKNPGVVSVPEGARTYEVIKKVDGFSSAANVQAVNMAAVLVDGSQVFIPKEGESSSSLFSPGETGVEIESPPLLININEASSDLLQRLPGVGPSLAESILTHRETQPFDSVEDLLDVSGIGSAKLEKMREFVLL